LKFPLLKFIAFSSKEYIDFEQTSMTKILTNIKYFKDMAILHHLMLFTVKTYHDVNKIKYIFAE